MGHLLSFEMNSESRYLVPQCMQNLGFSMKFSFMSMLSSPLASAARSIFPVSVEDIRTVSAFSFPFGIFTIALSSFPPVVVSFTSVSVVAAIGFPFLSSSCIVMNDFDFPSAMTSFGSALISTLAGFGITFGGVHDRKNIMPTMQVAGKPIPTTRKKIGRKTIAKIIVAANTPMVRSRSFSLNKARITSFSNMVKPQTGDLR